MPARQPYYILFDDDQLNINLDFTPYKVQIFDEMWNEGYSVTEIASRLQRKLVEIELLASDRYLRGKIKIRKGGMKGTKPCSKKENKIEV
nr:MAG TPA: Protein of unknown function (DUF2802) [Caudoviricetes sp.]